MRKRPHKTIGRHTDAELDRAIDLALDTFGEKFWILLHGVDAYMERRKRRNARRRDLDLVEDHPDVWGNS